MKPNAILFLGKAGDQGCEAALRFCLDHFGDVDWAVGQWGDPFPEVARQWHGDLIISYLSRWVVPVWLLGRAKVAAINFHPASPEFPGIGCCNFALYSGATDYGVTCHHMAAKVDTGAIIATRRFSIESADTVETLLERTYKAQYELFEEIGWLLMAGHELPASSERWTREPYTRKEFNELNRILPGMTKAEEARVIRACAYRQYSPSRISESGLKVAASPHSLSSG